MSSKIGNNTITAIEFNGENYNLSYRAGCKSVWGVNPSILESSGLGKEFQFPHPFELEELKEILNLEQVEKTLSLKKWEKFEII